MVRLLVIIFFLNSISAFSQTSNEIDVKVERKARKWDTLKYQKFETVLIVGLYQQYRTFSNEFKQLMNVDTSKNGFSQHTYMAESNLTGGIVFNYDKFQLSLGTRNEPAKNSLGKGYTNMFNIGLNVGDNRWVSENYYRRFKGFYNNSTPNFDTSFKTTGKYYLLPNLVNSLFMTRFMHFRNHENYSCKSGYGCNFRQLKSSATIATGGSFSVYDLKNDSAIIPIQGRHLYNDYANMRGFRSINISLNIGAAATLVLFKAWFITGYFTLGPEQQWRNYDLTSNHRRISYVSWSGTGRASMGLNMKKFYLLVSVTNDYNIYDSQKIMSFKSNSITNNFTFGWRFHYNTPKFYQKFMKTKLYSYL